MALAPGSRIGSHVVVSPIGEGGMGAVFRGHDTKLNRDVAIKVLLPEVASDAERLARFRREAQVLAALNHPNIAQIYGLEDAGDDVALILELVEGPTLADRIALGPVPPDEALPIAKQIAEALEAAHEQGIIHRDLKPANIKVRPDGTVKVLDFGLAKAMDPHAGVADQSPTITSPAQTRAGVILGTAAYMSPEQARGRVVDKRTDIWAFGCVLYEMLTGRRAFPGDDVTETLATIVKSEPDWQALPPLPPLPAAVEALLRQSLVKEPRQRVRDVGELRLAIDGAFEWRDGANARHSAAPRVRGWLWPAVAATAIAALAVVALAAWRRDAPAVSPPTRFIVTAPAGVRMDPSSVLFSRDGRIIAFEGRRDGQSQTYLRWLDALEAVPLKGAEGARPAAFSPDGQWLAVRTPDGMLRKVPTTGGPVVVLGADPGWGRDWSSADSIIVGASDGLFSIASAGGELQRLTAEPAVGEMGRFGPSLLPNGSILYFGWSASIGESRIGAFSPRTGESKWLLPGSSPLFLGSGHLVFARQNSLWAAAFDAERLDVRGEPKPVLEGIEAGINGFAKFTVSAAGSLAYLPTGSTSRGTFVWVDRQGREEALSAPPGAYDSPRISPDGRRVAFHVSDGDHRRLAVFDFERQMMTPITLGAAAEGFPLWTRDGASVVYGESRGSTLSALTMKSADGTGQPQVLTTADVPQAASSWSADGRTLVTTVIENGRLHLRHLSLDAPGRVEPLIDHAYLGEVSPDGKWITYASSLSGRIEVYVQPYPNLSDGRWQVSRGGGNAPVWGPAGDEIFYRTSTSMVRVAIQNAPTFRAGAPEVLFPVAGYRTVALDRGRPWDLSRDGQRFLMIKDAPVSATGPHIVVVERWAEELKRLVPVSP